MGLPSLESAGKGLSVCGMSDLECFWPTSRIPKKYPRIGGGAFRGLEAVLLLFQPTP